ncbi:hypothetical protein TWF594_008302 [Orbilia oligospora]|uniref:Uncharacterized protein n=1 Tax=Orbilia oligospora TaxID=2813651 RepID=A0A7C8NUM4_ORBOL|nr:hypothetical protein TWF703_009143 [Orbilia oligospora]KAF3151096.1 hypothetical protein TWF594_008302 [Orbilia oligospora]
MERSSFKKPEAQIPKIITQSPSPTRPIANNTFLTVPSHYAFQSRSPTPVQPRLPEMHDEAKVKISKPLTRAQTKKMQEGIIKNFCDRVHALEEEVGTKTAEAEKLQMQLGEITSLAKGAQTNLEKVVGQNKLVQESLSQLESVLRKIGNLNITHGDEVVPNVQSLDEEIPASGTDTKVEDDDVPTPVVVRSERSSVAPTPAEEAPTPQLPTASDVANLFDFHADDDDEDEDEAIIKKEQETNKLTDQQSSPRIASTIVSPGAPDPFAFDDAAVEAVYTDQSEGKIQHPHGTPSYQTVVPIKPIAVAQELAPMPLQQPTGDPSMAPFQKLADVMKQTLQSATPAGNNNPAPQQPAASGLHINAASVKGPGPAAASRASSRGQSMYTARLMTLPPDFFHSGNFPGIQGTLYEEAQLCDRASYTSERVPVLRLQNIPKAISVGDVLDNLAGGPLYRISTTRGGPDDTFKHVRITFVHLHHANAFLEFAQKNHGIYIQSCPNRIQVIQDPREKPNVISYTTFRKMMTENVTRMVYIDGFRKDFWTTRKLRDLIVVAVDKLRVEDPDRYQFKEPICDKVDIITAAMGNSKERGVEGLIGLRSIGWAILVRTALHGLQHPEGFYKERVEGELGPSINPSDNPSRIPTLRAFWVPDTVDKPLDRMTKETNRDG